MKALVFHGRGDFRLETLQAPELSADEVLLEISHCGICGSDLHLFTHGPETGTLRRRHPQTGTMGPIVGGHEMVGTVVSLGDEVQALEIGCRVAVRPTLPCRRCKACHEGRQSQCALLATIGVSEHGGFAEQVTVRSDCVYPIPDQLDAAEAAYSEPLACAIHGLRRGGFKAGQRIAIVGAGPIGLMTILAARAMGAIDIAVFEPSDARRSLSSELGASSVFDPREQDVRHVYAKQTGGRRADLVLECAGARPALETAFSLLGRGGKLVMLGMVFDEVSIRPIDLFLREQSMIASMGYDDCDFELALDFLKEGRIAPHGSLTSAEVPLSNILESGFEPLIGADRLSYCKILVRPNAA